jgi:hypothetical protein
MWDLSAGSPVVNEVVLVSTLAIALRIRAHRSSVS